jgi:hypothetical protein
LLIEFQEAKKLNSSFNKAASDGSKGKFFTEKWGILIPKLNVERARSTEQFIISFNYKHLTTANLKLHSLEDD